MAPVCPDSVVSRRAWRASSTIVGEGTNVECMPATRVLPTEEASALLGLVREISERELLPAVTEAEATETFPREMFRTLGRAGLLGLPYPEEYGGGGQPYEVYLQVVEEIATVWASVGVGVSVHALS